jgi:hypothetical protein
MPDYRMVKNPGMLRGTVIEAGDRGLTGSVDIRYRDSNTFVSLAVDDGEGKHVSQEHWRFADNISPENCRAAQ